VHSTGNVQANSVTEGDGRLIPNKDEQFILAAAAGGDGEYCLQRDWNKRWGADYTGMKNLEDCGFMKIRSAGRVPITNQWFRRSIITDAGRVALAAIQQ
jgi:hypothetical protein